MPSERYIDDVADQLKRNKKNGKSCALLVGAGCSKSAGIPLAGEFVEIIRKKFPRDHDRAEKKTYPYCMGELNAANRHELISHYIDAARINWAHIGIAQMIKGGYVDRVLTTNFDPLVMRACALAHRFPAVYDMAGAREFNANIVRNMAVFHLHGQRDGFVQLHDTKQVEGLAEVLSPVFDDTARHRTWLVIGYSGDNDPVFEQLARIPNFDNCLFWIGYRNGEPSRHVKEKLLDSGKDAHWIKGHDADNFLVQLADKLECFPPELFDAPFSHLKTVMDSVSGFRLPGQEEELEWAVAARARIEEAIKAYEALRRFKWN
jgi:hypothetical protein